MSNVKVGDMAIVIYSAGMTTPELAGMIVKVERMAVNGQVVSDVTCELTANSWICSSSRALPWKTTTGLRYVSERPIGDFLLRKVSGLPDEQHTEEDNKLEA